ncbi:YHS domain-containing (seleno)protein [Ponticoccus alexandrii]|uniref:YHS domain protein n=1 Tax=Ponticoccus alexandrii TaxID=1943633 RepID=A0ABX7FDG4_9RHOB|nr:YHS domain-containing (seleno)protein [Ponticoccus alexandrii]ETA49270.1 YHS domain protein [Rhodobacteraceae bacterium PD-2]QRF67703.1 YHS domain protein [Ponticoccus alexandrii]
MSRLSRRSLLLSALAAPSLSLPAAARSRAPEVYAELGVAIDGSDPVAYFDGKGPVMGEDHGLMWRGATWYFASPRNAARFEADPKAFAPQFGGYCAFAASRGYLAPTIPEAWTLHGGRLYLNASLRARELWLADVEGNIAKGRANWPGILG